MTTWLVMLGAGLGSYLLRVSMVLAHDRFGTPSWLETRLRLVGPSVLAALVVSSTVVVHGHLVVPGLAETAAVLAAYVAVRRTGDLAIAMLVGFPVYWLGAACGLS